MCTNCFAQQNNPDSLAYQLQRARINAMLLHRKEKFGQYDQSVKKHSGIFGMQTKKDIRRSNDILMDIDSTDDEIFRQIKVLLDFKAYQQIKVVKKSEQLENQEFGLMETVNKLKSENAQLKAELTKQRHDFEGKLRFHIIVMVLMLASILVLLLRKRRVKV